MTKTYKIAVLLFGVLTLGALCACDMYEQTYVSPSRPRVEKMRFVDQRPIGEVDDAYLDILARDYDKHGKGPLELIVTYDPKSSTNTATKATDSASKIGALLNRYGVREQDISILPVTAQGDNTEVLLSYDSYDALPPDNCKEMVGMESRSVEPDWEYQLGCTTDMIMVKQVARPKDFVGQQGEDKFTDGRRTARIVEIYRQGSKDKKLEGESASGL